MAIPISNNCRRYSGGMVSCTGGAGAGTTTQLRVNQFTIGRNKRAYRALSIMSASACSGTIKTLKGVV